MSRKLTLHLQEIESWNRDFLVGIGAGYVKIIDPPAENPFPGIKVIGRTFLDDGESNNLVWQGAAGAQQWFARFIDFYRSRPYVHAWEGPNEPQPMVDPAFRRKLDEFTVELARLMHGAGLKLVGLNFGVGWPDVGQGPEFRNSLAVIDYLGLHEYAAPTMQDGGGFLTLRYRRLMAELFAAGCRIPPIFLGEVGIDGGVLNPPITKTGWRTFCNNDPAVYAEQLAWYESELQKDSEVVGAAIFTVCSWDWLDFRVDLPLANAIVDALATMPAPPPPPEWAKGLYITGDQGAVDFARLYADGWRYVHIRATFGLNVDPFFQQNWEQAGAAGFLRSVVHEIDPTAFTQAAFFRQAVGDRQAELGEYGVAKGGVTLAKLGNFAVAADRNFGHTVYVCCSATLFGSAMPDWAANRNLWVIDPASRPTVPPAFSMWEFWQWSDPVVVPGVQNAVLPDRFNGTAEDLIAVYGPPPTPPDNNEEIRVRLLEIIRLANEVLGLLG
jgi:hypothetical protein